MSPNRGQSDDSGRQNVDFSDPTQVAVRMVEVEGAVRLVDQQVSMGLKSVFDQLASVQGDVREIERVVQGIANQQHEIQSHSSGLERLAKSIEKHVEQQEKRWEKHESENKAVADRVNWWRGVVVGVVLLAGLLVTAASYIVQNRFDEAANDRVRIDQRLDRLEAKP